MAKFVLFGLEGEAGVWLADLEAGTVSEVDPAAAEAAGAADAGFVSTALKARENGYSIVKGVNFAVATTSRSDASAHHMSTDPSA